jgi:putative acyl-CoA dehydrogenase
MSRCPACRAYSWIRCNRTRSSGGGRPSSHLSLAAVRAAVSADPLEAQLGARRLVQDVVVTLQAALLAQHSPSVVAETFVESRLGEQDGRVFGTLPIGADAARAIIERAFAG